MTVAAPVIPALPPVDRPARVRLVVGWAAVLGTLPYLTLKTAWISGSDVGVVDRALVDDGSMVALNAVTVAMDLVAVVVALAFTYRWGLRLPAWLVVVPTWIATGLLAPIAVALPFAGVTGPAPVGPLEPWVQPMVYTGFTWQGVTLLTAFVLYARERWSHVFTTAARRGGGAWLAAGAALVVAVLHLGEVSLAGAVFGSLALTAVAGVLLTARTPSWAPLALTWVGSSTLFAWGVWGLVIAVGGTPLSGGGGARWQDVVQVLAGLLVAATGFGARRPCTAASASHPRTRGGR